MWVRYVLVSCAGAATKHTDQSNLKKTYFGSQLERTVHHAGAVKGAAAKKVIRSPVRKKAERNATIQLAFSFSLPLGKPAHGVTLSPVRVGVPISGNLILIILHRHAQRLVSMVI